MNRDKTKDKAKNHHSQFTYWRELRLFNQFESFIPHKSNVLDIGSGSGRLASLIRRKLGVKITAVDVVDHNVADINFSLYDGKTLPFTDNSFDICLLVFVLHHATNYQQVIKEALRVSKDKVIVIEDTPTNAISKTLWRHWDYLLNHAFHKDVMVAHESKTSESWKDIFLGLGAEVIYSRSFRAIFPVLASYPHTVFVIKKK